MAAPRQMIDRLQALRFLAACLVLVGHVVMELIQHHVVMGPLVVLTERSWGIGVDIFFVISGFIITYSTLDLPSKWESMRDFLVIRLIRIWPIYALFTALMLVAVLCFPKALNYTDLSVAHIFASLSFIPWPRPDDGRMFPLLGQGWTLNYEMFFYVNFALALLLPRHLRVVALSIGGIGLVALGTLAPLHGAIEFYSRPILVEFLFGVLLCVLYRRFPPKPLPGLLAMAAAIGLIVVLPTHSEGLIGLLTMGVPALLLVGGTLFLGEAGERTLGRPLLVLLGNASYALYLSHPFVVNAILLVWARLGWTSAPLLLAVTVVGAIAFSVIVYKLVEQPSLKFLKHSYRERGRRSEAASPPTTASTL
jgi:peptidoglycan/LPS O-acetylase OafA/YrhL